MGNAWAVESSDLEGEWGKENSLLGGVLTEGFLREIEFDPSFSPHE